ncbi:MAG: M20 family metallopeptidase [Acidobacteriota bacterium]
MLRAPDVALALLLPCSALLGAPLDAEIERAAEAMAPDLVETRRDLHAHPELGNRESRTGGMIARRLRDLGLEVRHPIARTGVLGILEGSRPRPVVAVRADLDALPIQERNDVEYRSRNPGVMHACGHDAHTTIVLGTARVLAGLRDRLPGTVVFIFQPAEEGPPEGEDGGAPLMIREGALDRPAVEAIFGLHVDPSLDAGQVGWSAGPIFASSDHFVIEVAGRKTHGAYPHTGLDPIPVAAEIVQALQLIVSRQLDARRPKVLTIGSFHGGNRFNIVAGRVTMEGTIRTLDPAVRAGLKERMARTVDGVAGAHGAGATLRFVGEGIAPTLNDATLARASVPSLERVFGRDSVLEVEPQMGAEDFSAFAERVPGLYIKLGVRNRARGISAMIHTPDFDLDESTLPLGVRAMSTLVLDYLRRASEAEPPGGPS